jgi:hypothetical protein
MIDNLSIEEAAFRVALGAAFLLIVIAFIF